MKRFRVPSRRCTGQPYLPVNPTPEQIREIQRAFRGQPIALCDVVSLEAGESALLNVDALTNPSKNQIFEINEIRWSLATSVPLTATPAATLSITMLGDGISEWTDLYVAMDTGTLIITGTALLLPDPVTTVDAIADFVGGSDYLDVGAISGQTDTELTVALTAPPYSGNPTHNWRVKVNTAGGSYTTPVGFGFRRLII